MIGSRLPQHDVVLLGAGHTNAHVLRMWRMDPIPDARLTCVSNFTVSTYSGMLPGTLAGQYPEERMQIDLVRFCAAAGVRLICAEVTGLDADGRRLLLADRPPLPFDVLSVGIGSQPNDDAAVPGDPIVLAIKPMQTFLARLDGRLQELAAANPGRPLRLAVVGAGAGGVEIALCLPGRLRHVLGEHGFELLLVDGSDEMIGGSPRKAADLARRELESRGVRLLLGQEVRRAGEGRLEFADGQSEPVDLALWATGARASQLLSRFGLPTDDRGFLLTRPTLQTLADVPVFVVGDAGTIRDTPTPKAGVYAVRQGPFLWENIRRQLEGRPLLEYRPQRGFLSLLNTGDGRAIMTYRGFTFLGRWCWKLKDFIDGRFMDKYQDYRPMEMAEGNGWPSESEPAMRCAGCGGKVGGSVLSRVLARLDVPASEHVLLGLEQPDDAAIVQPPGGRPLVCTADFFAAFLDDPYVVGRVAALNAASDLFAMGARPLAALALATIPVGPEKQQEQLLYELLSGSLREFNAMGASLIGGHTIEGPQITLGYSMIADGGDAPSLTKAALRAGDVLVLTKPLGSGVLLAAHMQARCRAAWFDALLPVLLASNQPAAEAAVACGVQGMTDVTGFGLAGHLLEMLRASNLAAELQLAALPLLPGAARLVDEGLESTLAPANRAAEAEIDVAYDLRATAPYQLLFDPQTSGGMLLGVAEAQAAALLERLHEQGLTAAAVGRALPSADGKLRLRVL